MKKIVALILVLAGTFPLAGVAEDLVSSQMVDQARSWSQKGRDDLAAQVWKSLLLVEPNHPEALVKLGLIEARSGNIQEAKALYQRANRLRPPPKGLPELAAQLASKTNQLLAVPATPKPIQPKAPDAKEPTKVAQEQAPRDSKVTRPATPRAENVQGQSPLTQGPRPVAQSAPPQGQSERIVNAKNAPRSEGKPVSTGASQLQQAQTINPPVREPSDKTSAPTAPYKKWKETRLDLEKLAKANPGNPRDLIALAEHLTQRESTRREAVRLLEALHKRGLGTADSKKSWRKALQSLSPRDGDQALYSGYLARYPGSESILKRQRALEGKTSNTNPNKQPGLSKEVKPDATALKTSSQTVCEGSSCK